MNAATTNITTDAFATFVQDLHKKRLKNWTHKHLSEFLRIGYHYLYSD